MDASSRAIVFASLLNKPERVWVESVSTAADHLRASAPEPADEQRLLLEFFATIARPHISWDAVQSSKGWIEPAFLPNRSADLLHQKPVTLMAKAFKWPRKDAFFCVGILALSFSTLHAQSPQQIIQQAVNTERTADQNDHSNWIYLEESDKPKEHVLQWVAGTQQGNVERILEKDAQELPETRTAGAHSKISARHQSSEQAGRGGRTTTIKQIDDLLKLLPAAFIWTQTGATATTTSLHFEPAPNFHPPTREARVFSSMTGDLVVDNQQHRICKVKGHLIHDVTFGGGLLGRLKERSSFALEQQQVGPSLWELTAIHVHLEGNALLFKSVSLQQDDKRSRFQPEPANVTLEQAAASVMSEPELVACSESLNSGPASEGQAACVEKLTISTGLKP